MQIGDHGVVRLSIVPMRADQSDASEMISQLLFGEHYRVLEVSEDNSWVKVENAFDSYQGWIDVKQHHSISSEYFEQIESSEYKICTELLSKILFNHQVSFITCGAILPLLNNPIFKEEGNVVFNGNAKSVHQKVGATALISTAKMYLNTPYLWGGRSPFGIDCSGFSQVVFRMSGYRLPRDSSQQIMKGEEIKFDEHEPGDLAFFTNKEGKMNHVGILIGEGEVIHASGQVRIDQIDKKGVFNREQNRYTHHLFKIKRVLK
ncbi:C40 family peptidase [Roseivirga sp. E12]|uniref:C40 family peptidase n=1 Tax=Roseivirga sp. E12 TaxID=2819237 RepID=UPI001ABD0015|nr:C40 family peptidase [Roseivirga sp. E12]MBO3698484.1 C40 family peptidase [Roseivirga sp. E12]